MIALVAAPIERTTAATDVLVALLAAGASIYVIAIGQRQRWRAGLWAAVFALVAVSAGLGAVTHGLVLSAVTNELLWHPLYLALGLTVALFGVGIIHDCFGQRAARRALPIMIALGVGFYLHRWIMSSTFLAFIVYEAIVMVIALVSYTALAIRGAPKGAGLMALGVLTTIAAAALQAMPTASARLIWEFDHNGLFHLIQMVGIVLLVLGLRKGLVSHGT